MQTLPRTGRQHLRSRQVRVSQKRHCARTTWSRPQKSLGLRQTLASQTKNKWTYEVSERQFFNLYQQAIKSRGITGDVLLQLLELRIDNVVYRAFSCSTRRQARQLVSHGHVRVNGKKLDIPSALVKPGDTVSVAGGMHAYLKERQPSLGIVPAWLQTDYGNMIASCLHIPSRQDIDQTFEENLVIEYYSR